MSSKRSRRRIPDEDTELGEPVEQGSTEEPKDSRGFSLADTIDGVSFRELDAEVNRQRDRNVFAIAFTVITGVIIAAVFIMTIYFPPEDENDPERVFFFFIVMGALISLFIMLMANWYRNRKKGN